MSNPLMQAMGAMQKNVFPPKIAAALQAAGMMNLAMQAFSAYKSGKLDEFAQNLYKTNPQFHAFADANKGKTLSQMAQENGINIEQMANAFK